MTRQIILDTETTGLEPSDGHRIIEIGCVEIINRKFTENDYRCFLNPERDIDIGAMQVHGITLDDLKDKPKFRDVAKDFLEYIRGAELIIHNAPFDVGFLNHELSLIAADGNPAVRIESHCTVVDTLKLARTMHPGQKNDLDSLCRRYSVDNTDRTVHGARLDARLLAEVYSAMTGGQAAFFEDTNSASRASNANNNTEIRRLSADRPPLVITAPSAEELAAHQAWLEEIEKKSGGKCVWKKVDSVPA
jgi:DNA polymerase-3 subunit epsilon